MTDPQTKAPAPAAPRKTHPELPAKPARILIAEDEYLVATELTHTLAALGHVVVGPATDGESAVALARSAQPDMAIMDVRMPKRDGIAAAKELFEELGIPVITLSAYSDTETIEAAAQNGIFGYLVKPASADQLRAAISIAWQRYRQHVEVATEASNLRRRLEERRVIEQAKWLLVSRKGLSEPDAMKTLQKRARDTRRQMIDIAKSLIEADELI